MTIDFSDAAGAPRQLTSAEVEAQFRALFQSEIVKSTHTAASMSRQLGMTARNLRRILNGEQKLCAAMLVDIGQVLGIDIMRATIAIARFGDWRAYGDATLIIAVDLLKPVVQMVNEQATISLEPLHPKAIGQLSRWIAETVIKHQLELCARREELDLGRRN